MTCSRPLFAAIFILTSGLAVHAHAAGPSTPTPNKVQTTNQANTESLGGVVQAPLRDFNVVRTQIPEALFEAMADPYAKPASLRCAQLAREIRPLDDALGPDLDQPPAEAEGLVQKGRETTMSVMAGAATGVIPFRGWVRKITGADAHDQTVQNAIIAGSVRRAYLKGLGETRKCLPPTAPLHIAVASQRPAPPPPPPATSKKGLKPRYPIR